MMIKLHKFLRKIVCLTMIATYFGHLFAPVQFNNRTSSNMKVTLRCPPNKDTTYTLTPQFNATLALPNVMCKRITFEVLDGIAAGSYASLIPTDKDYLFLDSGQIIITYLRDLKSPLQVYSPTHPNWQKELD